MHIKAPGLSAPSKRLAAKRQAPDNRPRLVSGMRLNALDWVNFFLADVRGGLVAFVNVFLLTKVQWSQAAIGAVLSSSGLIGIMAHPAVGAFIDRTRAKRALIIAGAFVLSGCGLAIVW